MCDINAWPVRPRVQGRREPVLPKPGLSDHVCKVDAEALAKTNHTCKGKGSGCEALTPSIPDPHLAKTKTYTREMGSGCEALTPSIPDQHAKICKRIMNIGLCDLWPSDDEHVLSSV